MNTDFIDEYLKEHLSEKRRKHIQGVADTAVKLAEQYGEDPEKARIAALYHDMFKERDLDDLVRKYGLPDYYLGKRNLAHSKVAAAYMEQELGITDRDLINAVSYHTTGRAGMSKLEKILYLADSIEPGRHYNGVARLRKLAFRDLDSAVLYSASSTEKYLKQKGSPVDPDTTEAKLYYEKKLKEKSMDTKALALEAARVLDDRRGIDIKVIDVAAKSSFADYLIVVSGSSERQTQALADAVEDRFAELGVLARGTEGRRHSGWILIDFGDIVLNVFTQSMREKYNIENVWGDCELLELGEE
ncbi:MAG: bis(5'-nucleosyl)-tetraphosphatase (symmetrical) YqeK [Anaerovoracaceae bacterium]|jgi:ribosome silencing factor RsfS/YbeB/iojap